MGLNRGLRRLTRLVRGDLRALESGLRLGPQRIVAAVEDGDEVGHHFILVVHGALIVSIGGG